MTQPGLALLLTLALASLGWAQQQNERPLQPPMARAAFDEGLKLAQAGKLEAALTQFEEASRRGPTWSQSRYYEGACLTGLGRHAEAAEAFSRAVALNESYMLAWAARADAHFHLGNYAQSALDYGRVIELQPTLWIAHAARAEAALGLNQLPEAYDGLCEAIDLEPNQAGKAYRIRSQVCLLTGRDAQALHDAERAAELEADNVYAALWLAMVKRDLTPLARWDTGQGWSGALVDFLQGELTAAGLLDAAQAASDPATRRFHTAEAHCWIGLRADRQGDRAAALAAYRACVATEAYFLIEYRWALRRAPAMVLH